MAAIAVGVGLYFSADNAVESTDISPLVVSNGVQATATPASFTRGLQVHLRDSRAELVNLPGNSFDDKNQLLMQIIEQNRWFERAADSYNAPDVARLLRAFEPILMRLASDDIAPRDAEALRAQLAFELNVILTKLERRTSDDEQTI